MDFLFSIDFYWIFQQPNVIRGSTERNHSNYLFSFKSTFSCSLQVTSTLEMKNLLDANHAIQCKAINCINWSTECNVILKCGKSINSSKIFSYQCAGIIADHSVTVTGLLEYCCNVNITAVHPPAILQQQANTLCDPQDNCLHPHGLILDSNTLFQTDSDSCNARAIPAQWDHDTGSARGGGAGCI